MNVCVTSLVSMPGIQPCPPCQSLSSFAFSQSSCYSPPALCCSTQGVNQPATQMSIKAAFLTARSLLSMAFGIGEAVHQGLRVLLTPSQDVTQQAPLKGSSATVLHFEDTLKNPLSGMRDCDDLMCHV